MSEGKTGLARQPLTNSLGILRLLVLGETAADMQALTSPLQEAGYAVTSALVKSPLEFQAALKKQEWDLIISPPALPGFSAKQALTLLAHAKIDIPFIIMSDHVTDETLTEALVCGARTMLKRDRIDHLVLITQRELRDLVLRRARRYYEKMFRQSERRCHILLESSSNAVACVRNGKVIYANPAYNNLFRSGKDHESNNIVALIHPDDQRRFNEVLKGIESGKNISDQAEIHMLDANGNPVPAKMEAMIAYVNEQPCVQVSMSVNMRQHQPAIAAGTDLIRAAGESRGKTAAKNKDGKRADIAAPGNAPIHIANDDPAMPQKIRDALSENRFRLVYQPIVPLHAQPAENYEVLTRMINVTGEETPPAHFMPAAEKAGLMADIDRWVIRATMQTLVNQHSQKKEISLLVKLSQNSIKDRSLVPWIAEQLQEFHLPGDTIIFEIKEADITQRLEEAKQLVNGLKQLHCRTALGHFGADPNSLDHLEHLHVNFVKLAGSFADKLAGDAKSQAMIKAVVQTAHDLGTLTIATFVQDASRMATLWQCNVDYIQGYFLQAPDADLSYNFSADE